MGSDMLRHVELKPCMTAYKIKFYGSSNPPYTTLYTLPHVSYVRTSHIAGPARGARRAVSVPLRMMNFLKQALTLTNSLTNLTTLVVFPPFFY